MNLEIKILNITRTSITVSYVLTGREVIRTIPMPEYALGTRADVRAWLKRHAPVEELVQMQERWVNRDILEDHMDRTLHIKVRPKEGGRIADDFELDDENTQAD